MDEEYSESVDTSADMDVSDVDVSDDVPADIPDDIPEDVPEDDYSDADISEDVSKEPADDDIEYDETDESIEEDSIEPESDELDESLDDIEEDSLEESEDTTEDYEELNDIPEDTNGFDEEQTEEVVDDTEEIPEDTDDYEVTDQEEAIEEDIPEDVTEAENADEPSDIKDTDTTDQLEDVTGTETVDETSDAEDTDTTDQPEDVTDTETADEPSDAEDTDTAEQPEDMTDTETADETSDAENTDTSERPEDVTDTEAADEIADAEDTDTTDQPEDVTDTEATDETTDVQDTDTAEQMEDVSDTDDANHSDLETYDYETAPETQDAVNSETSGEYVSADNPYRERWEEFADEFSDGKDESNGWDSLKDVPFSGEEQTDTDAGTEGSDATSSVSTSEVTDIDDFSDTSEIKSISDYMNAHNYGPDDFATYSQDPQWRQLMRQEYPDYELPEMTQESAHAQLSQYMNDHNYGMDDYAEYSQDLVWRELHSTAFPDEEMPPLNDARQQQKPTTATSGGGNPPPGGPGDGGGNHTNPPDGSEHWVCPVCGKNPCVCDSGNDDGGDTPPPPDDPEKVLKRNEFDLLKSGNDAINQRLEAKADDYRDKGLSEEEIADRLAADKWAYQNEFLDDAFPGEDISPNVFNGFNEHGAKDRIDEMEKSPFLRELITGKRTDERSDSSRDIVDDKASEYNRTLKDFCESNGYVKNADFSDFDPHVTYDLAKSVVDAKKDFPELDVNYLGSIDHQVRGLHDTVEAAQFDFYKQNGFDEGLAQQMAKQYADDFISNSKLDDTEGTYAWSLRTGNPSLDKYDGVAVNNDYAKDYVRFKSEKQADEIAKWAPIGCGSPKAVADHELGHEIDNLLSASNDTVINDLYSNMMRDNKAEAVLSGYSRTNVKEFIAEAYSEYRNNPNPREISRAVYNRLIELRDQQASARRLI